MTDKPGILFWQTNDSCLFNTSQRAENHDSARNHSKEGTEKTVLGKSHIHEKGSKGFARE